MDKEFQSLFLQYLNDVLHGTLITARYAIHIVFFFVWNTVVFLAVGYLMAYTLVCFGYLPLQMEISDREQHGDGYHNFVGEEERIASISDTGDQGSVIIWIQQSESESEAEEDEEPEHTSSDELITREREIKPRMMSTLARDLIFSNSNINEKEAEDNAFGIRTSASSNHSHSNLSVMPPIQPPEAKSKQIPAFRNPYISPIVNSQEILLPQEPGQIIFHQFPRGRTKPCMSIDACFIETYIRLTEIPCEIKMDCLSTKGPCVTTRSKDTICGTRNCLKYVKRTFPEQTVMYASSHESSSSISLLLDDLSNSLKSWKWNVENGEDYSKNQPGWNRICNDDPEGFSYKTKLELCNKGYLVTREGLERVIFKSFSKLERSLGSKSFLAGSSPTEVDCKAFSNLSEVMWGRESSIRAHLHELQNLVGYCVRLKNLLWPDWKDQLCEGPGIEEYRLSSTPSLEFNDLYYRLSPDLEDDSESQSECFTNTPRSETTFIVSRREKKIEGVRCETESVYYHHSKTSNFSNYKVASGTVHTDFLDDEFSDMQGIGSSKNSM